MSIDCLAFGAHPDDVELFCSGLLIKLKKQGYRTAIADLTRGELSSNGDPATRGAEAAAAAKILAVDTRVNLELTDGDLGNTAENRNAVIESIRRLKPRICLVPYRIDRHPDHEAASTLLKSAVFQAGLKKIETDSAAYRPQTIIHYMLHTTFIPSFIVDISDEMETKMQAIKAYKSQFVQAQKRATETYINRPQFLASLTSRAEFYGNQINCRYGEPYYFTGMLKIDNILKFFA